MNITIKPRAAEELQKASIPLPLALRVDATLEGGGCGCNVIYSLVLDNRHDDDEIAPSEYGFDIVASPSTLDWIGDELTLNYLDNVGYTLANDEQTLTYGLKLRRAGA